MSFWDDVKPWVSKLAPMLGTALGGPLGGVAGALIGDALGIKDADPKSITAAIKLGSLTGDQILALKKAEQDFALQMEAMNIKSIQDLEELEYKDRDSARRREMEVKDWTPSILAYIVTAGFFLSLIWVIKFGLPAGENGKDAALMLLGALSGGFVQNVLGYYYGSSHSGDRANNRLADKNDKK